MFSELLKSPLQLAITSILMIGSIYVLIMMSVPFGLLYIFLTLVIALMLMVYKDLTTQVMKDRYVVMILSFLLVVVFWGAFEQAGGLMNIYAADKTDRTLSFSLPLIGNEVPATWFQSLNAMFIIIFGVIVANFWAKRKLKNKEASSIFKMATGVIIMGLGFLFMAIAAKEYTAFESKSAMYWLVLAYLLHTIGELCSSPVALSFITKLAPVKYASLMMGVYFAATGLGNKMAGLIGEFSQGEPATVQLSTEGSDVANRLQLNDTILQNKNDFTFNGFVYLDNNELAVTNMETKAPVLGLMNFENKDQKSEIIANLKEEGVTAQDPYHVMLNFRQEEDKVGYYGDFVIEEVQTQLEFRTFIGITIFTTVFGLIVIFMLKPLKRLTHGAEDNEREMLEQEQYEIADTERDKKNS
jgi:POT family proton-dependent oligopeptide transporter